ncbi:MAG TPA: hypothetical protein VF533_13450 [Solirubrobacteraceae bacterium]
MTLLLGLCGAQPASAMFTNVETVTKTTAPTSATKTATATCPAGKRVTGAGVDLSTRDGRVLIDYIRPDATLTSVTVSAHEDEALYAPGWTLTAYAVCAPAPAGLQRVAATSASSSAAKGVTATCPAGKRVLGTGGELAGAPQQLHLHGLVPSPDLTKVTVDAFEDETGTAKSWSVTAYAICGTPAQGVALRTRTGAYASGSPRFAARPCEPGEVPVGMGGSITGGTGNQLTLQAIHPTIDDRGPGVVAAEDRTGTAGTWSLTAYTICGAQIFDAAEPTPTFGDAITNNSAACDEGTQVVGTGAETDGGRGEVWLERFGPQENPPDSTGATWITETGRNADVTATALCATAPADLELVIAPYAGQRPDDPVKTATATCPAGKRVLSGGAQTASTANHVMLQGLVPSADLTSVRATLSETENGLPGDWSAAATALCATPPPGLQRVSRTTVADSAEIKTATIACPAGKHAVGAGAAVTPALGQITLDDIRFNAALTAVTVEAFEDVSGTAGSWSLTAHAVCVSR